jgi:hypothetical protein
VHDPDPTDTTIETVFVYPIKTAGRVRVELDRHVTGRFGLETWLRLLDRAGFDTEMLVYDVHGDGRLAYLLVGTTR